MGNFGTQINIPREEIRSKQKHERFLNSEAIYSTLVDFAFDSGYYLDMLQSDDPDAQFAEMVQLITNYPDMFNFLRSAYYEYNGEWLLHSGERES